MTITQKLDNFIQQSIIFRLSYLIINILFIHEVKKPGLSMINSYQKEKEKDALVHDGC